MDPNLNTNPNPAPTPAPEPTPAPNAGFAPSAEPAPAPSPKPASVQNAEPTVTANPAPAPSAQANPGPAPVVPGASAGTSTTKEKKPLPKKLIIAAIIALVVLIIVILGIIFIPKLFANKKLKEAKEIFSEKVYIPVKEGDKYGYIDLKGNMKISPQFDEAGEFEGGYAPVATKNGDDYDYAIIDRSGETVMSLDSKTDTLYYISETGIWVIDDQLYDKNLSKILDDNEVIYDSSYYNFIVGPALGSTDYNYDSLDAPQTVKLYNRKGKSVYEYTTSNATISASEGRDTLGEQYCALGVDKNVTTVVNCDSGKVVAENLPYNLSNDDYTTFNRYTDYSKKGYYVFFKNKIVHESDAEYVDTYLYGSSDNLYLSIEEEDYDDNEETNYYIIQEDELTQTKPATNGSESLSAWEIYSDSTIISCGNNYGIISGKTQVVPCSYSAIRTPDTLTYAFLKSKGKPYIIGRRDDTSELIDATNGKVITTFNDKYADFETQSTFVIYDEDEKGKEQTLYNLLTGKSQTFVSTGSIYGYPMYAKVYNNDTGHYDYYNKNLEVFYSEKD